MEYSKCLFHSLIHSLGVHVYISGFLVGVGRIFKAVKGSRVAQREHAGPIQLSDGRNQTTPRAFHSLVLEHSPVGRSGEAILHQVPVTIQVYNK